MVSSSTACHISGRGATGHFFHTAAIAYGLGGGGDGLGACGAAPVLFAATGAGIAGMLGERQHQFLILNQQFVLSEDLFVETLVRDGLPIISVNLAMALRASANRASCSRRA